jgi:hypothetical protein
VALAFSELLRLQFQPVRLRLQVLSNSYIQFWNLVIFYETLILMNALPFGWIVLVLHLWCLLLENSELEISRRSKPKNSLCCPHNPTLFTQPSCLPLRHHTVVIDCLRCPFLRVAFVSAKWLFGLLLACV